MIQNTTLEMVAKTQSEASPTIIKMKIKKKSEVPSYMRLTTARANKVDDKDKGAFITNPTYL